MKNTIALLLLVTLTFTACKDNPKNNADDEAKKAQQAKEQRKAIEAKCYKIAQEHLMETRFSDTLNKLDTLTFIGFDTATEKMAKANKCDILLDLKNKHDNYVKLQANIVEASENVSPMLAEPEKKRLEVAKLEQEAAEANYNECLKALNKTDSTQYKYYQVGIETISTFTRGKMVSIDTTQSKFYIDKENFEVKLF